MRFLALQSLSKGLEQVKAKVKATQKQTHQQSFSTELQAHHQNLCCSRTQGVTNNYQIGTPYFFTKKLYLF